MKKGFTLIELLVVVAIIGVLASVVLASLNSARDKGKAAAIKSNLKNMIPEAELAYDTVGNYSTACASVAKMLTAITNAGATSSCYSYDNTRWGASGIIYNATPPVKAWSGSGMGAVTWDVQGVNSVGTFVGTDVIMNGNTAVTACATSGGRLPTLEELRSLSLATFSASGSYIPPGFISHYWSGTTVPSDDTLAYSVNVTSGTVGTGIKSFNTFYVRCVR